MSQAILEHVNYTTKNPQKTAAWMQKVFGWTIRWEGPALNDGYTIHIGGDAFYIALYAPADAPLASSDPHRVQNGLNHLGVIVEDLAATEVAAKALGFVTYGMPITRRAKDFISKMTVTLNLKLCPIVRINTVRCHILMLGRVRF